jgi:hypothetical protein
MSGNPTTRKLETQDSRNLHRILPHFTKEGVTFTTPARE